MQRRLLIIWKDPEFDNRGEVVLGQCEPFTSGWSLTMILPDRTRESLMVGTYTDLRKIQESCAEIDDPVRVRKRVQEMRALMLMSVTETVALSFDKRNRDSRDETRDMAAVNGAMADLKNTPGGLLAIAPQNSILVLTVAQLERVDDADYLRQELMSLLEHRSSAVLFDLTQVQSLPVSVFKELSFVRDRMRDAGIDFALCNVSSDVRQKLQTLRPKDALVVYDTQTSGLQALQL